MREIRERRMAGDGIVGIADAVAPAPVSPDEPSDTNEAPGIENWELLVPNCNQLSRSAGVGAGSSGLIYTSTDSGGKTSNR
jgi:hypothetical protein